MRRVEFERKYIWSADVLGLRLYNVCDSSGHCRCHQTMCATQCDADGSVSENIDAHTTRLYLGWRSFVGDARDWVRRKLANWVIAPQYFDRVTMMLRFGRTAPKDHDLMLRKTDDGRSPTQQDTFKLYMFKKKRGW